MDHYLLVIAALPPQGEGNAKYLLTIGRTDRQAGFGSMKTFSSFEDLIEALRGIGFTEKALAAVEADVKSRGTHIVGSIHLSTKDFIELGVQPPQ